MTSEHVMETRRRSRSKTPFLRSNCDHENCDHIGDEPHTHHKKRHTPVVKTIIEETVEVISDRNSPSKQFLTQSKIKTSDYSSEESPENKTKTATTTTHTMNRESQQQQREMVTKSKTTTTTVVTNTKTIGGGGGSHRAGSVATSTPKASNFVTSFASQFTSRGGGVGRGGEAEGGGGGGGVVGRSKATAMESRQYDEQRTIKEHTQNVLNSEKESSRNKSHLSGFLGNSFGADKSIHLDSSDHIAYLEYKKAGEYWKTTPKTDYTYSELSPHRRELAPGIVAMPNMSRKSLENHHERINYMIERDPTQEEYIRRRYEATQYMQNRKAAENLTYDSGDEVDVTYRKTARYYNKGYNMQVQQESWLMRIITTIVTTFSSTWASITGSNKSGMYNSYSGSMYYTKLANEERGFFGTLFHGISSVFGTVVRSLYLLISSVLCLDTWLLQSSNAENKSRKRFLLFLLMLLPLLLLAGIFYYLHPNETFPPKSFSQYTFTIPELPKIDMSEYLSEEKYNQYKSVALNSFDDLRDWSNDYFLYLKTISQNIIDSGRKAFQREEEHFERI